MPAKFTCAICYAPFISLLLPQPQAAQEAGMALQTHLLKAHPKEAENAKQEALMLINMASTLAHYNNFVIIDEGDVEGNREYEEIKDKVLELMGLEKVPEGEGEEEGEGENEEPDNRNVIEMVRTN